MNGPRFVRWLVALGIGLSLWGCASAPTHFYVLNPVPHHAQHFSGQHLNLGIGPVTLPKYLNQPQIVTREYPHKLHLDEFNRWAEGLDDNITRVLGDNLASCLPACRILNHPWGRNSAIDLAVSVDVRQFEYVAKQCRIVLRAGWTITDPQHKKKQIACHKTYQVPLRGEVGYHKIARLMSQALYQLSRDIAHDIRRGH